MAFFSEVKAKLGLDISEFERGMSKAQQGVGELGNKMGKQIAGTEKIGSTLATALGLNLQTIAESIARFVIGSSKEAEKELEELVKKSEEAAIKTEANLVKAKDKNKAITEDVSKLDEKRREKVIGDERLMDELLKKKDAAMRKSLTTKEGSTVNLEARKEIYDLENKIGEVKDRMFKEEVAYNNKLKAIEDARAKEKEDQAAKQKELAQQLAKAEEQKAAKLKAEYAAIEQRRKDAVSSVSAAIRDQAKATYGEVASGERGTATDRARAQQAEQLRERARRIIDQGGTGAEGRAAALTARADKIQQSIESTKSGEKTSLSSEFTSALDKSAVLEAIKQYLSPTKT